MLIYQRVEHAIAFNRLSIAFNRLFITFNRLFLQVDLNYKKL